MNGMESFPEKKERIIESLSDCNNLNRLYCILKNEKRRIEKEGFVNKELVE